MPKVICAREGITATNIRKIKQLALRGDRRFVAAASNQAADIGVLPIEPEYFELSFIRFCKESGLPVSPQSSLNGHDYLLRDECGDKTPREPHTEWVEFYRHTTFMGQILPKCRAMETPRPTSSQIALLSSGISIITA